MHCHFTVATCSYMAIVVNQCSQCLHIVRWSQGVGGFENQAGRFLTSAKAGWADLTAKMIFVPATQIRSFILPITLPSYVKCFFILFRFCQFTFLLMGLLLLLYENRTTNQSMIIMRAVCINIDY